MSRIQLEAGWLRESIKQAGRKLEQVSAQTYSDEEPEQSESSSDTVEPKFGVCEPFNR